MIFSDQKIKHFERSRVYNDALKSFESTIQLAHEKKNFFAPLKALLLSCFGLFKKNVKPLREILNQQKEMFEAMHPQFNKKST